MAQIVSSRNLELTEVEQGISLGSDFESKLIDFKEMNAGFIQIVTRENPTLYQGKFEIKVSLICDDTTFVPYPNSARDVNADCNNFGWEFCCLTFRYAMVCYTANGSTDGIADIYARAKRT